MLLPLAPTAAHADDPSQQSAAIAIAMQTHHMNLAPPPAQPHAPAAPSTRRGTHARRREAHTRPSAGMRGKARRWAAAGPEPAGSA
mmetsp:Transcript_37343/g.94175  ORF Transcript_37343/g.94175 Transcript_37343/m.94175 type:complete len:86 (+) Transcript_37343:231-488(+)